MLSSINTLKYLGNASKCQVMCYVLLWRSKGFHLLGNTAVLARSHFQSWQTHPSATENAGGSHLVPHWDCLSQGPTSCQGWPDVGKERPGLLATSGITLRSCPISREPCGTRWGFSYIHNSCNSCHPHFLTGTALHQSLASSNWATSVVDRARDRGSTRHLIQSWRVKEASQERLSEMTPNMGHGQGGENDF